jgi:hypothetical protein
MNEFVARFYKMLLIMRNRFTKKPPGHISKSDVALADVNGMVKTA